MPQYTCHQLPSLCLTVQSFFKIIKYNRDTSFCCFHHTCKLTTIYTVSEQRNNRIITRVPNYQVRQLVTDYFRGYFHRTQEQFPNYTLFLQVQSYIMRPGHADNCNSHTKSLHLTQGKKKNGSSGERSQVSTLSKTGR